MYTYNYYCKLTDATKPLSPVLEEQLAGAYKGGLRRAGGGAGSLRGFLSWVLPPRVVLPLAVFHAR